ncbi:MAG: GAF and ANTAR domain-containing protein [Actinobacteria bacterium]|jgi:GAF domain-containing protein|nr:GAF and ANTAR domain-containing protein [Actinomycetota bacterium]
MMVDDLALRAAFRDFTQAVLGPYDVDRMLHLLTDQVVAVLGVDGAGVSLATGDGTHLKFVTATSDDIAAVEDVQVSLGEGPCHEAYRTGQQVTVPYLELEDRWLNYRKVGLERGMRAVAGIPMPVTDRRIGALNLYRLRPHSWGREELETAQLLADMASGYILNANQLDDAQTRSEENLKRALESRDVIGQAKGILMAQHQLTAEAAFELLRRTSQDQNVKLRELAAQVVEAEARRTKPTDGAD